MSIKLFSPDIPKSCTYCEFCKKTENSPVCSRKNTPLPDKVCRHYIYDPLKRVPHLAPQLPVFSADDFKL